MGGQGQGSGALSAQGTNPGQDRSLQPMQLYLSNPHNLCYSNATFIGLHWAGRCLSAASAHQPSLTLGRLLPLLSALQRGTHNRPLYTPSLLGFQLIFQGFPRFKEQHDACEFLHHCLLFASAIEGAYCWEARLHSPNGVTVHDKGLVDD